MSDFDDFMDGIELDVKPLSPEDALMIKMKSGSCNDLHLLRYWLIHEMHCYYNLLENNVHLMRKSTILQELKSITREEFALIRVRYYLQMKYLPWFEKDMSGLGVVDLNDMAKIVLEHDLIAKLVATEISDLPKLRY